MARTKRILGSNTLRKRSRELFAEYDRKQAELDDERTASWNRASRGLSYYDEPQDPNEDYFDERQEELDNLYKKAFNMERRANGNMLKMRRERMNRQAGLIAG